MNKSIRLFLFPTICMLLSSCGTSSTPAVTPPVLPVDTPTSIPTSSPAPTQTSVPAALREIPVIGYLPDYRALDPAWGASLTDLIYFSAEPTVDGELDTSRLSPATLQAMREMKAAYGTRLFISLGGYGRSDAFGPMVTDAANRQKFIRLLLAFAHDNGLDGIDFDWEFPSNDDEIAGYRALMDAVKEAGLIVSVALYPYDDLNLAPYQNVDRVYIMSYDRGARHSTYEQAVADLDFFLKGGVPREKLYLGIPFYGRLTSSPYTAYDYVDIVAAASPFPDQDEVNNIYFNGVDTIQKKVCYVRQNDFGGVMIWELGQDTTGETSLLQAVHAAATGECQP